NLNINSGGIIYDVEHDPHNNVYILVGDFNSIGGISVNNIAFVNDQTFAVDTSYKLNVIQAIDGPIHAVELRQYLSRFLPFNHFYHLFLGGAFSNVTVGGTSYSRPGICKLYHSGIGGYIANTSP